MPTVDLATTIVPNDHRIWKLFPGEGYKFERQIDDRRVAFLDVRGLDRLPENSRDWRRDRLENIASLDRWRRQVAATGIRTDRRVSAADKRTATYVDGLLNVARKGDFLAVPSQGADAKINIYELVSRPGSVSRIEARDRRADHIFLGRRVRWLGAIPKRNLKYEVIELLQTPVAFFDLGDAGRDTIYEAILGNYVYEGEYVATYRVAKEDYNSRDNRIVSTWMEFVDLASSGEQFAAALKATQSNAIPTILDRSNLDEALRSDLSININSPGDIVMAAKRLAPLIGLALFQLAANGVPYNEAIEAETQLTILGGAVDNCTAQIDASVRSIIEAMGAPRWIEACEVAQSASQNAELSTDANLE
ncbi:hypothetical protein [Aurantiacibacter sediminis]|uniref:Phage portal protein n=1 Tax=Aurantiacibacter sediminis TaxID=2793064 RepID=A0ABS0N2V3_9SPHN|nr:hypothetical protein [Aurantiacibacter sediminis]MBH5322248.1 hypothetical protein [Aurantiacibacter sediminis]